MNKKKKKPRQSFPTVQYAHGNFIHVLTSSSTSLSELVCVLQDGGSRGLLPGDITLPFRPSFSAMSDTSALRVEGSGWVRSLSNWLREGPNAEREREREREREKWINKYSKPYELEVLYMTCVFPHRASECVCVYMHWVGVWVYAHSKNLISLSSTMHAHVHVHLAYVQSPIVVNKQTAIHYRCIYYTHVCTCQVHATCMYTCTHVSGLASWPCPHQAYT